jgi:hypothetical protein
MSDMSPSRSDVVPAGVPAGTDARSRAALEAFASHGYTPAGVQLPDLTGYTSHMPPAQPSNGSSNKRRAPSVSRDDSPSRAGPDAKRAKQLVDDGSAAEAPLSTQGPSPVKDLNQLGRFSPSASLRGARPVSRVRPGPPDSSGLGNGSRFASRPHVVSDSEPERRARELMTELFVDGQTVPAGSQALEMLLGELPEGSADVVIDDHGHTALHWAAALARLPLVELLLSQAPPRGADVHAGNHAGETALQRAVLVTNAYEASAFPALLHLLGATLHTRDFRRRTILHHIALICALPKRAASARYYLACVLDHLTRVEGGRYASLVDAQDEDGETALGIVARGGNGSMVRMLLEVGARKDIANQLGIRPRDWGIEGEAGEETSELAKERPADAVAALKSVPPAPVQKSADVQQRECCAERCLCAASLTMSGHRDEHGACRPGGAVCSRAAGEDCGTGSRPSTPAGGNTRARRSPSSGRRGAARRCCARRDGHAHQQLVAHAVRRDGLGHACSVWRHRCSCPGARRTGTHEPRRGDAAGPG